MSRALISLGSNMGDRRQILQDAVEALRRMDECVLLDCSALYETKPWGYKDQDDFLNAACTLETALDPLTLLERLQGIERDFGRERHFRYGPRTLDLDLIAFAQISMQSPNLTLPHPHAHERAFVLVPLCEICPDEPLERHGMTIRALREALPESALSEVKLYAQE